VCKKPDYVPAERIFKMMLRRACVYGIVALLPVFGVFGCSAPHNFRAATLQAPPPAQHEEYVLQVGDLLGIKFYFNPELNEEVVIRPDGMISLQLIGDVQAAGLTPSGLAATLTQKYVSELATPKVSVIVRQFGLERVYVSGEVGKQGIVPMAGGLTLYQAIQQAGGLLDSAHRKQVILIRRDVNGRPAGTAIDIRPIESGEHPEDDVLLQPLDIVFVPKSKIGNVDMWVDQYMRKLIPPVPFAVTF
jgi:polysaccharide export outer membrane protein